MSRLIVQQLKKAIKAGTQGAGSAENVLLSRQSALSLLERSIELRHGRLAVIRLDTAVQVGASIPDSHWRYCLDVVTSPNADERLRALYRNAARSAAASPKAP